MPSIDLQDAKASRAQDDAIPCSPAMPDPADVTQDSPVEPTHTPGPRRSTRSTRGVAPQRVTYQVRGQPTTYYLPECYYMIKWLDACDQREYMKRKFLARPRALVKEIEKKLQLCYCNKSVIFNRDSENMNESEKTFRIKPIAVYQHDNITSRLMDWVTDVTKTEIIQTASSLLD